MELHEAIQVICESENTQEWHVKTMPAWLLQRIIDNNNPKACLSMVGKDHEKAVRVQQAAKLLLAAN